MDTLPSSQGEAQRWERGCISLDDYLHPKEEEREEVRKRTIMRAGHPDACALLAPHHSVLPLLPLMPCDQPALLGSTPLRLVPWL